MSALPDSYPALGPDTQRLERIQSAFPYLSTIPRLHFLDTAASSQKPQSVIDAITQYYTHTHANIHRGVYQRSQDATRQYDDARKCVASFIGANSVDEIVFTRGTTESFNLLSQSYLKPRLQPGDEIILSYAEHHANIVPWHLLAEEAGLKIKTLPLNKCLEIDTERLEDLITERTRLISLTHISNALGILSDVSQAVEIARSAGVPIALDGAQAVAHLPIDVAALDCDFYMFSGHKVYGPTGIGVFYAKESHLKQMRPYQGGGDMIEVVEMERSSYLPAPQRFEAGTPHISGAIALAEALRFVSSIGFDFLQAHDADLQDEAQTRLDSIPGIRSFGTPGNRRGAVSFVADWGHPHDIGTILDSHQVAVRSGHHCAQPLMNELGVAATTRISFGMYNDSADLEALEKGLRHAHSLLG